MYHDEREEVRCDDCDRRTGGRMLCMDCYNRRASARNADGRCLDCDSRRAVCYCSPKISDQQQALDKAMGAANEGSASLDWYTEALEIGRTAPVRS